MLGNVMERQISEVSMNVTERHNFRANLEIMTFRYLKTIVFDKCFSKLQHY